MYVIIHICIYRCHSSRAYIYIFKLGYDIFRSYITTPTPGQTNPGLVEDGTRCGIDRLCIDQECHNVSSLKIPSCPTGSNGLTCSGNMNGVSLEFEKTLEK